MSFLVILQGPEAGRQFPLAGERAVLGRNIDCTVPLTGKQVSRQHANLLHHSGRFFVEDLGSSNGTYVNGKRISPHAPMPIGERDSFQIGPYLLALRPDAAPASTLAESSLVVRETVSATSMDQKLFAQDPAAKLQVVLDITQQLGRTLEVDPLLDKLIEQLMKLWPQADRILVILLEEDNLVVRAQRSRAGKDLSGLAYSRTIVRRALDEGIGLISEDLQTDQTYQTTHSILSLDMHSIICVPLITQEGRRLGVIQVDRFCHGFGFRSDDLHLLTAVSMQVAVVLENVALHAEKLREQRLMQELALAHEIQEGYLPDELEGFLEADFEIFGKVYPARQVAGDFYDFVRTPSGKLAFVIGDVSGKGMPAALYMIAVRTLCRHLVKNENRPADFLANLNVELADDNPMCMFVTLAHGVFDPATGHITLASAGHPAPLLRRMDGHVETVQLKPGRLLGYSHGKLAFTDTQIVMAPGDTLFFFTDGFFEARAAKDHTMFGMERVVELLRACPPSKPLPECTDTAKHALDQFTGSKELQDDLTLLVLRRLSR